MTTFKTDKLEVWSSLIPDPSRIGVHIKVKLVIVSKENALALLRDLRTDVDAAIKMLEEEP